MREEVDESAQPLDLAGTIRTDGIRVPAPMREDTDRKALNLSIERGPRSESDAYGSRVPAPRLELECGGGSPDPEE